MHALQGVNLTLHAANMDQSRDTVDPKFKVDWDAVRERYGSNTRSTITS